MPVSEMAALNWLAVGSGEVRRGWGNVKPGGAFFLKKWAAGRQLRQGKAGAGQFGGCNFLRAWQRGGMKCPVFLCCALATATPLLGEEEGFTPLFNGKNLDGWVNVNCAPETWSVKDGVIACTGAPIGALRTPRQYENFIMEVDWRHLKPAGNAGIFIWASPISAPGQPFLRAIEVQVLENDYGKTEKGENKWFTSHGDVFPIHGSKMVPLGRHNGMRSFPSGEFSLPSPQWNHYRIEANAGKLRLSVNGHEVSGGDDCTWRKGYLGLESEGSPLEFKNIRIKELPPTGATAEQTAPVETTWKALYNGVDLRGWKAAEGAWKCDDWTLVAQKPGEALVGETAFAEGELIIDVKLPKPGDGVVSLTWHGKTTPLPKTAVGKWERCRVRLSAGGAVAWKEGEAPAEPKAALIGDPASDVVRVSASAAGIEIGNLYFRPPVAVAAGGGK